jgi:hypothetical protein
MSEFMIDFSGTITIKANTIEEAMNIINAFNVLGLNLVVVNQKGKLYIVKSRLDDFNIHDYIENPAV